MGIPFWSSMRTAPSSGRFLGRDVSGEMIDAVIVLFPLYIVVCYLRWRIDSSQTSHKLRKRITKQLPISSQQPIPLQPIPRHRSRRSC